MSVLSNVTYDRSHVDIGLILRPVGCGRVDQGRRAIG